MENLLVPYVLSKIHELILTTCYENIVVCGFYDRTYSLISKKEKSHKLFNWKRPTAYYDQSSQTIYIYCFPGQEYVSHYMKCISFYVKHLQKKNINILGIYPSYRQQIQTLKKTGILEIPSAEMVVIGAIEQILSIQKNKIHFNQNFAWSVSDVGQTKVLFLGCQFSFWGDIISGLVEFFVQKNIKAIIYTGKLGALKPHLEPNITLATGSSSCYQDTVIKWSNLIKFTPSDSNVETGTHVHVSSVLDESKTWFQEIGQYYSFVDPEVFWLAHSCQKFNLSFGYIHLISDNVAVPRPENLINEREPHILNKRKICYAQISKIINYTILFYSQPKNTSIPSSWPYLP